MEEIFKPVLGWENSYEVSNLGNARSIDRYVGYKNNGKALRKGILLKLLIEQDGYHVINIKQKSKCYRGIVHRLVAQSFIPNPENKPQVNHINGIKTDNRIENLEWVTCKENIIHAFKTGLNKGKKGSLNPVSKKIIIVDTGIEYESIFSASLSLGIDESKLRHRLHGRVKNKNPEVKYV